MDDLIKLGEHFGFSAVVLAGLGIVAWRVLKWAQPRAERVIEAHVALVHTLTDSQKNHGEALSQLADTTQRSLDILTEMKDLNATTNKAVTEMKNGGH